MFNNLCLFIRYHWCTSAIFEAWFWYWRMLCQRFALCTLLLRFTYSVQKFVLIKNLKFLPISEKPMSKLLFYYLPICIIFTMNAVFSILTAMDIRRAQRDVNSLFLPLKVDCNQNQTNLDTTKYNYALYLRLFIVCGITWSVDALAFISPDGIFFYMTDICNSLHGLFIFILFIMKPRVLRLIKNRFAIFKSWLRSLEFYRFFHL